MANPYQHLVDTYDALLQTKSLPLFDQAATLPTRKIAISHATAPRVVLFSPHPDDECIMGALPLRLMQEMGCRVTNIAVTLGSDSARQAARWQELQLACQYLGFKVIRAGGTGLNTVTQDTRAENGSLWQSYVSMIAEHIRALQPEIIIMPHQHDAHPAHQGTYALVIDALKLTQHRCWLVQAEFWQPLTKPNLMVACSNADITTLMTGLACHVGEVSRNPYHLRLPAWMADNVRRGAELLAGQGQSAPNYSFATLYRLDEWEGNGLVVSPNRYFIATDQMLAPIFQR
jgi:LmbE family N-acetylglucosaminyl deacetylase